MTVGQYFFAPCNQVGNNIYNTDTYLYDDTELWNAAGYRYDFDTFLVKLAYQMDDNINILGVYEAMNDKSASTITDDRTALTGKISYQYDKNAALSFIARHISCASNEGRTVVTRVANGAAAFGNAGGANTGVAGEINVDDVTMYRVQLDIQF
jgi:hypothetical protein